MPRTLSAASRAKKYRQELLLIESTPARRLNRPQPYSNPRQTGVERSRSIEEYHPRQTLFDGESVLNSITNTEYDSDLNSEEQSDSSLQKESENGSPYSYVTGLTASTPNGSTPNGRPNDFLLAGTLTGRPDESINSSFSGLSLTRDLITHYLVVMLVLLPAARVTTPCALSKNLRRLLQCFSSINMCYRKSFKAKS